MDDAMPEMGFVDVLENALVQVDGLRLRLERHPHERDLSENGLLGHSHLHEQRSPVQAS
jgi:hypothetical protein